MCDSHCDRTSAHFPRPWRTRIIMTTKIIKIQWYQSVIIRYANMWHWTHKVFTDAYSCSSSWSKNCNRKSLPLIQQKTMSRLEKNDVGLAAFQQIRTFKEHLRKKLYVCSGSRLKWQRAQLQKRQKQGEKKENDINSTLLTQKTFTTILHSYYMPMVHRNFGSNRQTTPRNQRVPWLSQFWWNIIWFYRPVQWLRSFMTQWVFGGGLRSNRS